MSNLVIVESPAKAKTIKKYLGSGYEVVASMGHIRDCLLYTSTALRELADCEEEFPASCPGHFRIFTGLEAESRTAEAAPEEELPLSLIHILLSIFLHKSNDI